MSKAKKIIRKSLRSFLIFAGCLFITSIVYTIWLKWVPPFTTPLMVTRSYQTIDGKSYPVKCRWRKMDQISDYAKIAVIASEDQLFAFHNGFDFASIEKAIKHNERHKRVRGASTISQQVAKNVFLWSGRSWLRKGLEVYFTVLIEIFWSKERILQMYLNVAEMGKGIFGVEEAAQYYFHKSAKNLTINESALIAAILPNPIKYNALNPGRYIQFRQRNITRFMRMIGGKDYLKNL